MMPKRAPGRHGSAALIVLALAALFARRAPAQNEPGSDSGTFRILLAQKVVGTEKFRISRGAAGWEASGELQLSEPAAVAETSLLRLDASLRPTYYERRQRSPKTGTLTAQFSSSGTSLVSVTPEGSKEETFYLPDNFLVVLDTNLFHQYSLLLRQYDAERGGAQPFNVFIPQEALPGTITLEMVGKETPPGAARPLDHYKVTTDELEMDLWATPEKTLQRISIPNANLEVVRQ